MTLRKILLATDFSEHARAAQRRARLLASANGAEIVVLHAFDPGRPGASIAAAAASELVAQERSAIATLLEATRDELASAGLRALQLRVDGRPGEVIPVAARSEAADLVVLGSHGRTGLRRLLLGSIAEKVVRASEVPVLVARGPGEVPFRKVLVATDLGEPAEHALAAALQLVEPDGRVDVVHFVHLLPMMAGPMQIGNELQRLEADAHRAGAELVKRHRRADVELSFRTQIGEPREGLIFRVEEHGHDLIALGSHGKTGLRAAVLGSVSESLVRHAPCSVLVVR